MFTYKAKRRENRSANVKKYLSGFRGLNLDADEIDDGSDFPSKETGVDTCSIPNSQRAVSVLVEVPEELDLTAKDCSHIKHSTSRRNQKLKDRISTSENSTSNSAAVVEIGNNLMDLDNYMLSAFHMSDEASLYTKATADTGFSSSNSSSSISSTRKRHKGAFRNRIGSRRDRENPQRLGILNRNKKAHNWLDSMKESSMNIFEDGDGWTPSSGWRMADATSAWDMKPDRRWNAKDTMFDCFKTERFEI